MTRAQIMRLAWAIKATNKENLFSECLRLAWQVSREMDIVKALELLGFSRWTKTTDSGKVLDRMYINAEDLGFHFERSSNSTYIHKATRDGEHLSNNRAKDYSAAKTYVDLSDMTLHFTKGYAGEELGERAQRLLDAISF